MKQLVISIIGLVFLVSQVRTAEARPRYGGTLRIPPARSASGRPSSAPSRTPPRCALTCSASRPDRTTSGRPTTRRMPSGFSPSSRSGVWTPGSRPTMCSSRPLKSARWSCSSHALHRQAGGADGGGRPDFLAARGATPQLQRLFHRWRRDRAAGVRQLRRAGRLRGAGPAGDLSQGGHRDCALRRKLARHQAQGGGRAWRHRLPDLFGPARRRLLPGRYVSQRSFSSGGWRAARQRDGHADLPRRPAHARRRRHQGRQAPAAERSRHPHQDSRAAHFLWRRAAAAGGAQRSGGARAAGAARCPSRTMSAPARPRCI